MKIYPAPTRIQTRKNEKMRYLLHLTPRCDAHRGVKLCGVHPSAESSSAVCITPQSQTAHRGVKIKIFRSPWLLLKGQSRGFLFGVNNSIIKEKI